MKLLALIASAITASFAFPASAAEPVHVMILGTYHFDNPGQDLNNIKADDVLKPRRQEELEALASALATFKPTKIMVERVARTPDLIDPHFTSFAPDKLRQERDERYQIGYRIAHQLKLGRVYAIDEQPEKGEPDYFPFGAVAEYAQANGMGERLKKMMATPAAETKAFEERQRTQSIAQLLLHSNEPTGFYSSIGGYYETLAIGDTNRQPGADLNAMWYLRNAKIFSKLMTVAQPGDRVLVVYGSGHNYWLRHFATQTPGFRSVDPRPYLKKAAAKKSRR
ncbi:MAG: DUF5694 domain-containing protein [Pseudomonadota bacterium]|nr:DUF5694 domain-containing protein [Pseudomonadota bacterium]